MVDPNIWKNKLEQFLYLYGLSDKDDDLFNISSIPSIPDIDTIKTAADVTHIWESPTARIKWRNLTSDEKQAYTVISHTEQCEQPSVALLKFIGIDEDVLMILSTTDASTSMKEPFLKKGKVVITEEKRNIKAALEKYHCQVLLLLLSETDALTNSEMEDISLLFKGNKIICCCCIGISSLSFQCLFSAFEEVPIGGKMGEMGELSCKFFIRNFEDKIGSSNATQWYCNELTSAEREEYTIMTTDELEKYNNCKTELSLLFFMLKDVVNDSPTEEEFFLLVDYITARVSNFKLVLFKDVVGRHLPQKIEIDAMIKFIGTAPVLSVFSGVAFIENLLKLRGVNVRATDNYSGMFGDQWMPVESMDAVEAVKTYCNNNEVLFMSCPTPSSMGSSDAFYVLKEFKGQKVIYIGENTSYACDDFLNLLLENNFKYVESNIPSCKVNFSEVRFYIRT